MIMRIISATLLPLAACAILSAQVPQIPTLQVCNLGPNMTVKSTQPAKVTMQSRLDNIGHTGTFIVNVSMSCDSNGFPAGMLNITGISMTDSSVQGTIQATTFEQLTSTGMASPTAYMNGRCVLATSAGGPSTACHYWIMFVDNKQPLTPVPVPTTPDIISFLVVDKSGKRIAYGTGPVTAGNLDITGNGN
jgi:hypothetical protein